MHFTIALFERKLPSWIELTTIGLVFFAVSAINPAALARPKAAAIAFNHGDRDHRSITVTAISNYPIGGTPTMDTAMPTMTHRLLMMAVTGKILP